MTDYVLYDIIWSNKRIPVNFYRTIPGELMATIKVGIDVSDNGTAQKATQAAERLKQAYDAAGNSAQKINVPSGGGTGGGGKSMAGAQARAASSAELVEYNRQRAIAQNTGASARDFAKQSEGLGGLVRLYATFAANVFAVTAAFGALSRAMDTTNMIKGLDQLGAASGQALGGLSKRFVDVTDGAISLREAVEAVAKSSAAGLSGTQILQIADNAKKASQALGVDMSDAVSRLSRGITKLEPELLDELGIYTKLEESVNKYALRLGKTASSLTDFERRQAFAVAVLDEANKKFGAIELDTNPYNKLLATFRNVLQTGLELINTVLAPVISLLSQSPVALAGILALIGKSLVTSALPALGEFRKGLDDQVKASKELLEVAQKRRAAHRTYISELEAEKIGLADKTSAEKAALAVEQARTQFSKGRTRPAVLAALPTTAELKATELSQQDLDTLQAKNKEIQKRISIINSEKPVQQEAIDKRKEELRVLQAANIAINERIQSAKNLNKILGESVVGTPGITSKVAQDQRELEKATRAARGIELVQSIAETYDTGGFNEGFKKLGSTISANRKELGLFQTAMVGVRGAGVLLAGGLNQIIGVLGPIGMAAGLAATAFSLLDSWFSKNSKQAEEASKAFELVDEALKNIDMTAAAVLKRDPFERISIESISATAKSVNELSTSLSTLVQKVEAQQESANIWDKFTNGFKALWGGDVTSKAADRLTQSIEKLLKTAGGPAGEKAAKNIEELVGVDPKNTEAFRKALNQSSEKFLELAPKVSLEAEKLSNSLNNIADSAKQAGTDLDTASKSQSEFVTSALPSDKLSKFGIDLVKAGNSLKNSLKDTNSELAVLNKLLKDPEKLKLFSKEFQDSFLENRNSIQANVTVIQAYRAEIEKLQRIRVPVVPMTEGSGGAAFGVYRAMGRRETLATQVAPDALATINALEKAIDERTTSMNRQLADQADKMIKKGVDLLKNATAELLQKAAATITLAKIELLGNTEEAIRERTKVENSALDTQIASLNIEKELVDSQDSLQQKIALQTVATEELTAVTKAGMLKDESAKQLAISQAEDTALKAREAILKPTNKSLVDQAKQRIDAQIELLTNQKSANILKQEGQLIDIRIRKEEEALDLLIRQREEARDKLEFERSILGVLSAQKQQNLEDLNLNILTLQQNKQGLQLERERQKIQLVTKQPGVSLEQETEKNKLLQRKLALETGISNIIDEAYSRNVTVDTKDIDNLKNQIDQKNEELRKLKSGEAGKESTAAYLVESGKIDKAIKQDTELLEKLKSQLNRAKDERDTSLQVAMDAYKEYFESREYIGFPTQRIEQFVGKDAAVAHAEKLVKEVEGTLEKLADQDRTLRTRQTELYATNLRQADKVQQEIDTLVGEVARADNIKANLLSAASTALAREVETNVEAIKTQIEQTVTELGKVEKAIQEARSKRLGGKSLQDLEARQSQLTQQQELDRQKLSREAALRTAQNQIQLDEKARESINKLVALEKKGSDLVFEEKLEKIRILEKLGGVSAETQIKRQAELDRKQEEKALSDRINAINDEQNRELAALRERQQTQRAVGFEDPTLQPVIDATITAYEKIIAGEEAVSRARKQGIEDLKEQNLILESQNKLISALETVAKSIGDAFGSSFGTFFNTFGTLARLEADFLDKSTKLYKSNAAQKEEINLKYGEDEATRQRELFNLDTKYQKDSLALQLQNTQQVASATKGFFKEKTFAYKTLSIIEKVAAAQTLALNLQTMASNLATLPGKIAGGVGMLVSQGGFAGLAAAAGFLALMASLGFRKGGPKVTPGIPTEESRRVQTTGQFYSGNTLMTRSGALQSDPTEKLDSIDESLKILKDSGFDDLKVFNKMSKSLDKIDLNTRALSESLAISLGKTFSVFQNSVTNTNGLANFLAKPPVKVGTTIGGAALGYLGGITLAPILANAFVTAFGSAAVTSVIGTSVASSVAGGIAQSLGVLGGPVGLILGAVLGANLDKIVTSIFGGKKTTTVRDFGITVEGTIDKIAQANTDLIKGFAELDVKISGGWFRRNKYFVESLVVDLDQQVNRPIFEYIGTLFTGIKDSLVNSAEVLGTNIDSIIETAVIEPIKVSTKDAKPEEIAERIKNQTSAVFNEIALKAFGPLIEALREPLEEAGTTLTRITTQSQVFSDSMLLLSKNVENITGTLKAVIADDLVKAFGGLEEYENKVQFFRENFLTEAEQIAPVSQKLTEAFQELKISSSLTRDQYKALVLQQDLTTTSGRETFTALLNLGEAFDKVTDFAEKAKEKLDSFSTSIRNFIKEQTLQIAGSQQGLTYLLKEFQTTVEKSLQGDEKSLSYLTDIAGRTIESARSSSRTTREFNLLRAGVVSSLAEVATQIESGNLELLTPQEQANVILKQIESNTAKLPEDIAQTLAKQIDNVLNPATATATTTTVATSSAANDSTFVTGGEGQGGPTQSGPITAGQLALANAVVNATNTLSDTIKGNPLLGLFPGAGLVVLTNTAAKDVINQANIEANASVAQAVDAIAEANAAAANSATAAMEAAAQANSSMAEAAAATANALDAIAAGALGDAGVAAGDALGAFGGADPWKKGGAFLKGAQMFADGGAFSNSVVSNPTVFPMGVMGEAGPEAIMPLTRRGDGSLGVTADIPFNNNNQANEQLIREVRELKKEMEKVRMGVEVTATGTNKTFRLLDRVTENGDAFNVLAVEGSVTTLASVQGGSF